MEITELFSLTEIDPPESDFSWKALEENEYTVEVECDLSICGLNDDRTLLLLVIEEESEDALDDVLRLENDIALVVR